MSASEQDVNCDSIYQYVHRHNSTDPDIKSLCEKWMEVCQNLNIDLHYVRCKMDNWFLEVYRARMILLETVEDATGRLQTRRDALYRKFFDDFDKIIEHEEVLEKIQMISARDKIKTNYGHRSDDWLDLAVQCVEAELELLNKYTTARMQKLYANSMDPDETARKRRLIWIHAGRNRLKSVQIQEAIQNVEHGINNARDAQQRINQGLRELQSRVSRLRELYENSEEKQEHFRDYQVVQPALPRHNGSLPNQQYFKSHIEKIDSEINNTKEQVKSIHEQVCQAFEELHVVLNEFTEQLKLMVKEWQLEFQYNYAEMVASPDLDRIAPWCAETGKMIHDVLHGSIVNWQNILSNIPNTSFDVDFKFQQWTRIFKAILTDFIQSTFVVTEQGNFFIKTGNKRFPKFSVRVFAADLFSKHSEETAAHFVSEEDLKQCWRGSELDIKKLEKLGRKLKSNKIKFSAENGQDKMECCFQNLQFAQSFKRSNKEISRQVHEEKYRVVFVTKIESATCWTLSLPLVVTTASNQEAHSLASIMWQCFSTDVFSPASDIAEELPWSDVADMLQKKIARLSTKHRLSQENIAHLKYRLLGDENLLDDTPVSLTQFCWNYMQDTEVSFWKWFLGIYNLIEQYLQQFWNDGLIMGFVKKEVAEQMLERCGSAGTFILRFSDKHFTNSDGRKSVYGRLTSCVVVMKEVKGNKRNSFSQHEPVRRRVVEHVDVADFKKLGGELKKFDTHDGPKNNLANILKETWIKGREGQNQVQMYRYLYPSGKSREELFDKYCEEGSTVSGYRHTREAYIAILEQAMTKVNISSVKDESVSSGMDTYTKGAGYTKKPRRSRDNAQGIKRSPRRSSSCQSNISSPQGSPFHNQSPQSHSQSPCHVAQSPGPPSKSPSQSFGYPNQSPYPISSPAQSVPSPAFSVQMQTHPPVELMVPSSDEKSQLPTFLTEDSSVLVDGKSEINRPFTQMQSDDNFQAAQDFDAMEMSSGNEVLYSRANQSFTSELFYSETELAKDDNSTSVEGVNFSKETDTMIMRGQMPVGGIATSAGVGNISSSGDIVMREPVVPQEDENLIPGTEIRLYESGETPENEVVLIVSNNDGQYNLNIEETPVPQSTLRVSQRPLLGGLTVEQYAQVQRWQDENRRAADTVLQHTHSQTFDTGTSDTPVSTSSGSSGEVCGYSANQLAAMGSGDIDPNFARSIMEQDNQDGNASNT